MTSWRVKEKFFHLTLPDLINCRYLQDSWLQHSSSIEKSKHQLQLPESPYTRPRNIFWFQRISNLWNINISCAVIKLTKILLSFPILYSNCKYFVAACGFCLFHTACNVIKTRKAGCLKVVSKFSQSWSKVAPKWSKDSPKIVPKLLSTCRALLLIFQFPWIFGASWLPCCLVFFIVLSFVPLPKKRVKTFHVDPCLYLALCV